jgi:hypothetical protein
MRIALLLLLVVFGGSFAEAIKAQTYCAVTNQGATNCAFTSVERCRDEIRADGGFCIPQAPIGHRQPHAADLPAATSKGAAQIRQDRQSERKLDRSLQLCRGC